jgi:hypothetical protein
MRCPKCQFENREAGMFYVWLGVALWMGGKAKDSYEYLCKALELGEDAANQKVVGYACTWLTWACAELGLFVEGIGYGEKAQKIATSFPSDHRYRNLTDCIRILTPSSLEGCHLHWFWPMLG